VSEQASMNFEPGKVIRNALDFYISSGIVATEPAPAIIEPYQGPELDGDRQKLEQVMLFVLGHLMPDYAPLQIIPNLKNNYLRTCFQLPQGSSSGYYRLFDNISQDQRLAKLTESSGAKLRTSLEPPLIYLDFPIHRQENLDQQAILNPADLKHRFESLANAATMIESYLSNGRRHLSLLEQNINASNFDECQRHLHALRNGAVHIFALALKQSCSDLEIALGTKPTPDLSPLFMNISEHFSQLHEYYKNHKEQFHG
jgi:HPt (histidine-containing phosphotransfer) domain-containing protein